MSTFTERCIDNHRVDFQAQWSFDRDVITSTQRMGATLFVVLALCFTATSVHAEQGEHALSVGISWLTLTHPDAGEASFRMGGAADLGYRYALDDFWEIGGVITLGVDAGGDPKAGFIGHALFETRYVIDALTWVPYLCAGVGALARTSSPHTWVEGSHVSVDLSAHAGLGVEWRPARSWSLGIVGRYHLVPTDFSATKGPIQLSFLINWFLD